MSERKRYEYQVVDVFTQERFAGNPLAVFPRADGIDGATMQRIAQELNLSETVFVLEPTRKDCVAKLRIFTPARELKFAGHPTVGTSFVFWEQGRVGQGAGHFLLEEGVGAVPVRVEYLERPLFWLTTPVVEFGREFERTACAEALALEVQDLMEIAPQWVSAGNPAVFVSVEGKGAVDRAWPERASIRKLLGEGAEPAMLFVFTPTPEGAYSRMFAPELGVVEDPATGRRDRTVGRLHGAAWLVRARKREATGERTRNQNGPPEPLAFPVQRLGRGGRDRGRRLRNAGGARGMDGVLKRGYAGFWRRIAECW